EADVRFSTVGGTTGVVGAPGALAGDRAPGRLVDARSLAPRARGRWMPVSGERGDGDFRLAHGDELVAFRGPDIIPRDVCEIGDDLAIVVGDERISERYADMTCLVELAARRVRWTVESDCDHAVRTGDTVVCASGCGIAIRRLDDGRTVTHWTAPYASSLAVARDAIATRTRSV